MTTTTTVFNLTDNHQRVNIVKPDPDQLKRLDQKEASLIKQIETIQQTRQQLLQSQQTQALNAFSIGTLTINGSYVYRLYYKDTDITTNTVIYNIIQDKPITNWRPYTTCKVNGNTKYHQATYGDALACLVTIDSQKNETIFIGDRSYFMKHKTHLYVIHSDPDHKPRFFPFGIQVGTGRYCVLFTYDPKTTTLIPNKVIMSL